MTETQFYDVIRHFIKGMLPEKYAALTPEVRLRTTQAGSYVGFWLESGSGMEVAPVINLTRLYETYGDMEELDMLMALANEITQIYDASQAKTAAFEEILQKTLEDYENEVKPRLFLAPASLERRIAGDVKPCRFVSEDLAIQIRMEIQKDAGGRTASAVVTQSLLILWEKTFAEVYADAEKNMESIAPTRIDSLYEVMGRLAPGFADPDKIDQAILVVSNEAGRYGAANLFLPGVMDQVAERTGGSFYVIPSSVDEVLILPLEGEESLTSASVQTLETMICEVNEKILAPEDRLAQHGYFYKDGELSIAGHERIFGQEQKETYPEEPEQGAPKM